ncbi:CocE/NonD family hydrolase [Paenibacillus xylanilyticus]|uniref:CocE/NonD family hydrolase n=1 Tax=Paenibacillus xylanilyticus TaxID=248903 RepID=UPI00129E3470|nr:CocE/NonD family hydrolase [Paenibacillus xylanilyticus]
MKFGNVVIRRKVPCTMRDGITLYSDIYLPDETGEYPVLLMRQPYGRSIASTVTHAHPVWYASKGYIVVIQDVRGRGESEGEFNPFVQEAEDGFDTIKWAAGLSGSTGKIGMYGFSYQGLTQWAAASLHPPALQAIAPSMCPADMYHGLFYPHGSFALGNHLPWAFQLARDTAQRAGDFETAEQCSRLMRSPDEMLWKMPLNERHPILEQYFPAFYDWIDHQAYDEYWEQMNWINDIVKEPVPALHIGGWYDGFLMGTLQSFEALQATATPDCFHRLVVGPWAHIPWGRRAGGIDHGEQADGGHHLEQLRWFDYWLKGKEDMELSGELPIRYFDQLSHEWHTAEQLPSLFEDGASPSEWFYLSGSQTPANGAAGGGRLEKHKEDVEEAVPDVFVYDSRLPMRLDSYLPSDRAVIQERQEILVYTGGPLAEDIPIFGSPELSVQYQTLGGPTDLVAILTTVSEQGTARLLSVGRTEICSEGADASNEWRTAQIRLRPLAATLPAGSYVRLELTGSAFPLFARHPNGVRDEKNSTGTGGLKIATTAVRSTEQDISCLRLPVKR